MRTRLMVVVVAMVVGGAAAPWNNVLASVTCPNVISIGKGNTAPVAYECATVSGGYSNEALADYATVGGGWDNTVGGGAANSASDFATVGGGAQNTASGFVATVGGGEGNTASDTFATVGGGYSNTASSRSATVGGGRSNTASSISATVGGGIDNSASAFNATVGGGQFNKASGFAATVGGGSWNSAAADYATIAGGGYSDPANPATVNRATDNYGTIGGGGNNQAGDNAGTTDDRPYATVGGGQSNSASGSWATVGGGESNTAGLLATVPGGFANDATGDYSFAAGHQAKAVHPGTFVWGDSTNADIASTGNNQFVVRASGGVTFFSDAGATAGVRLEPGTGSWSTLSDRNAKANITAVDSASILERVAAIPIQLWNYKTQDASVKHIGPMAQDFSAAFGVGENDTTISTVDADGVALAAIQGLNQKLDKENQALKARLTALETTQRESKAALASSTGLTLSWSVVVFGLTTVLVLLIASSVSFTLLFLRRRATQA